MLLKRGHDRYRMRVEDIQLLKRKVRHLFHTIHCLNKKTGDLRELKRELIEVQEEVMHQKVLKSANSFIYNGLLFCSVIISCD